LEEIKKINAKEKITKTRLNAALLSVSDININLNHKKFKLVKIFFR